MKIFVQVVVEQVILPELAKVKYSEFLLKQFHSKCIISTSPQYFTQMVHLVTAPSFQSISWTTWLLVRWHWQKYEAASRLLSEYNSMVLYAIIIGPKFCQSMVPLKYGPIELLLIQ